MASDTPRIRLSAVAVKAETTQGQDAFGGSPALSDFIAAEMSFQLPQQVVEDPTLTGSFDRNAPIPTGIRPQITLRVPLRGSGVPATAPEWGKLMTACRFEEVAQAASVGAPTAASAGTDKTITLAAPFAGLAQVYRGMPLILAGNPAGGDITPIIDYTAGRVATLGEQFGAPLSNASMAQIPVNFLYRLTDDETLFKPVTIYGYRGGLRWRFVGCKGSAALEMRAGQPAFLTFTLRGQLIAAYEPAALVTGWNTIRRPQPPIWANGLSRLDYAVARCATYSYNENVTMYDPENPEAPQGFDSPEITEAAPQVTIDPFSSTTSSPGRFAKYQSGASFPFVGMIGAVAGNRFAITNPALQISQFADGDRGTMGVDGLTFTPSVPGAGMFLCAF